MSGICRDFFCRKIFGRICKSFEQNSIPRKKREVLVVGGGAPGVGSGHGHFEVLRDGVRVCLTRGVKIHVVLEHKGAEYTHY